jgi:hypothetical protein
VIGGESLSKRRIRLIAGLLSLALLVAQLGAEGHAFSHLTDQHGMPGTVLGCGTCVSFAPLLSAAAGAHGVFAVGLRCEHERIVPDNAIFFPYRPPARAFQPRAPPSPSR